MEARAGVHKGFSRLAKAVILAECVVLVFLSFGMYEEFLNNINAQQSLIALFLTRTGFLFLGMMVVLALSVLWAKWDSSRRRARNPLSGPASPTLSTP